MLKKALVPLLICLALGAGAYLWNVARPRPLEKGRQALAKGDATRAIEILVPALNKPGADGAEKKVRFELARAYMVKGSFDLAEDQLRQILGKWPRDFSAHLGLGFVSFVRGFEAYALDSFLDAKRADPADVRAPLALASLYRGRRDFERAKQEYRDIMTRDPSNRPARQGLADVLMAEGLFREAINELEHVVETFSEEQSARLTLVRAYFLSGQVSRAEQEMRLLTKDGRGNADTRWLQAEMFEGKGHRTQALEVYEKIYDENPRHLLAGLRIAALYARLGSSEKSRSLLESLSRSVEFLQEAPVSFSSLYEAWDTFRARSDFREIKTELHLAWARYYMARAVYPEAEEELELALKVDDKNLDALRVRAELHRLRREPRERFDWLVKAAEIYPHHPQIILDRADALLALKRVSEAQRDIMEARVSCPSLSRAASLLSRALLANGKISEARAAAEEALSLDPGSSDAHLMLGLVFKAERQFGLAQEALEKAVRFDPYNAKAHQELGSVLEAQRKIGPARSAYLEASRLEPVIYFAPRL